MFGDARLLNYIGYVRFVDMNKICSKRVRGLSRPLKNIIIFAQSSSAASTALYAFIRTMKTERRAHNGRATQTYSSRTPVMAATECPGRRASTTVRWLRWRLTWGRPEAREVERRWPDGWMTQLTREDEEEVVLWVYNLAYASRSWSRDCQPLSVMYVIGTL